MKWFFTRKTNTKKVAPYVENMLLKMNEGIKGAAIFLQRRTKHYSYRKWKLLLLLFCSVLAGVSVFIIYNSFQSHSSGILKIAPIRAMPIESSENQNTNHIDDEAFNRIHLFKRYLDSLSRTTEGKRTTDSLLAARPHLMDTISYLEQLYQHSLKTQSYGKENAYK